MNQTTFLEYIKEDVIQDMQNNHILASMTAAQAFIESKYGTSGLAVNGNNLFGIKGTYNSQYVLMNTKEYVNGQYITIKAKFKKYPSWKQSIEDHSAMFHRLSRYHNLIGVTNYKTSCILVKNDGYATAPDYTNTLITTIEKYKLYEWDNEVLASGDYLKTDGINNPYSVPTTNIKYGSKGNGVKWLQFALNEKGYNLTVDGIAGKNTINALMDFQNKNNLTVDGICGKKTIAKLI